MQDRPTLEDVLATDELTDRAKRQPEFALESQTLSRLSTELTSYPGTILRRLVEAILECCRADSAGVSIVDPGLTREDGARSIRWQATAGELAEAEGRALPVEDCPVRVVLDQDDVLLFDRPARYFSGVADIEPVIREALVAPFHVDGQAVGGVWAMLQTDERQFDGEDERLLTSLSRFAATGYQLASSLHTAETHCEELGRRVHERAQELERANEELRHENEQREKLAGQLRDLAAQLTTVEHRERKRVAALLHDNLQQLLAAAAMQIEKWKRAEGAGSDAAEKAADLLRQADRASRNVTEQLRPPALYEAGLLPALRELAEQLQHDHEFEVSIEGSEKDPVHLDGDSKALLFGGVRELLFNVLKHADTDSATVRVHRANPGQLRITVEDRGTGFDPNEPASHDDTHGFGLFSLKERVEALGGDLTIDAAVGRGARVDIDFPADGEDVGQGVSGGPADKGAAARSQRLDADTPVRVLIVDHTVVRQSIASTLENDPRLTVVGEAHNGTSAIEAVEHHGPDVIVMDVHMPEMDGIEATRRIHAQWPEITIVGLSVQDDQAIIDAMCEAGAVDLVSKTVDLSAIITAIVGK